jgi:CheY-like chemotaxis protein
MMQKDSPKRSRLRQGRRGVPVGPRRGPREKHTVSASPATLTEESGRGVAYGPALRHEVAWTRVFRPRGTPPHILVAEDHADMRNMLVQSLRRAGYQVTEVPDGWGLLTLLGACLLHSQDEEPVDLVISDIRMPGVTGMEVLRGAEDAPEFPPIILITAFGDQRTHEEAERLGAKAIFDKPFDLEDLLARVQEIVPWASSS